MGDFLNGAQKLRLTTDGKTVENWVPYALQIKNLWMGKEIAVLYCDDVLRNEGNGKRPDDPGLSSADWIAGAGPSKSRSDTDYAPLLSRFRRGDVSTVLLVAE